MSTARTRSLEPSPTTTSPSTTAGASESPPQGRHRGDTITLRSRSSRRLRTTVHRRFRRHPCHFPSHSLDILELPVVTELPRTFHTATVLRRGSRLSRTGVCRDVRRTLLGRLPSGTIPSGLRFRVPTAAHHCRYHWRIRRARYFPGVLFHPPRPVTTNLLVRLVIPAPDQCRDTPVASISAPASTNVHASVMPAHSSPAAVSSRSTSCVGVTTPLPS